jgi:hypothetical protein
MTTSETSKAKAESILIGIIEIVASSDNEIVKEWSKTHSVIVNLSLATLQGYCELTADGELAMRSAFSQLAEAVDVPEDQLISYLLFSK